MPSVPIYIRKENMARYLAIESPSEWINTLLANSDETPAEPAVTVLRETVPELKYDDETLDEDDGPELYRLPNYYKFDPEMAPTYAVNFNPTTSEWTYLDGDGAVHRLTKDEAMALPVRTPNE